MRRTTTDVSCPLKWFIAYSTWKRREHDSFDKSRTRNRSSSTFDLHPCWSDLMQTIAQGLRAKQNPSSRQRNCRREMKRKKVIFFSLHLIIANPNYFSCYQHLGSTNRLRTGKQTTIDDPFPMWLLASYQIASKKLRIRWDKKFMKAYMSGLLLKHQSMIASGTFYLGKKTFTWKNQNTLNASHK